MSKEGTARKTLRETADRLAGPMALFFEDALQAERQVWATCQKCKRTTPVDVPDWAARQRAVEGLLSQGYGRPQPGGEGGSVTFVIERHWPLSATDLDVLTDEEREAFELVEAALDRINANARAEAES